MVLKRLIPTLLLKDNTLVKGNKFRNHNYIGDPINTVKIFNEKEVDELIFLDIEASRTNVIHYKLIQDIAKECFMPFSYGGGLRNIKDVEKILNCGAEKVVLNSYLFENIDFLVEVSKKFGAQSIIISIDVKRNFFGKYIVYSNSAKRKTYYSLIEYLELLSKYDFGELLVTSIACEGSMQGYDKDLLDILRNIKKPLIYQGGVTSLDDIGEVFAYGIDAVSLGSKVVYQSKNKAVLINYPTSEEKDLLIHE